MRMGFTGTRLVPFERVQPVCDFIFNNAVTSVEFTTGACIGFDAIAAHCLLDSFPDATHRLVVPANLKQVDFDIIERFDGYRDERHCVERMPTGSSYRDRNARILWYADELLAVAEYPEADTRSLRSGTWMTVRMARKLDKKVHLLTLSEL